MAYGDFERDYSSSNNGRSERRQWRSSPWEGSSDLSRQQRGFEGSGDYGWSGSEDPWSSSRSRSDFTRSDFGRSGYSGEHERSGWGRQSLYGSEGMGQGSSRDWRRGGGYQGGSYPNDNRSFGEAGSYPGSYPGSQSQGMGGYSGSQSFGQSGAGWGSSGQGSFGGQSYGGSFGQGYGQSGPSQFGGSQFGEQPSFGGSQFRRKYSGKGPKNYKRSKERILDDVNETLSQIEWLDAREIDARVEGEGVVVLSGSVDSREAKRMAEDLVENIFGVNEVRNELRVKQSTQGSAQTGMSTGSSGRSFGEEEDDKDTSRGGASRGSSSQSTQRGGVTSR